MASWSQRSLIFPRRSKWDIKKGPFVVPFVPPTHVKCRWCEEAGEKLECKRWTYRHPFFCALRAPQHRPGLVVETQRPIQAFWSQYSQTCRQWWDFVFPAWAIHTLRLRDAMGLIQPLTSCWESWWTSWWPASNNYSGERRAWSDLSTTPLPNPWSGWVGSCWQCHCYL